MADKHAGKKHSKQDAQAKQLINGAAEPLKNGAAQHAEERACPH